MFLKPYDARDWYWRRGDVVYGSARAAVAGEDDAAFAAWSADGTLPAVWPRDEAGKQTDAALSAVLEPYGVDVKTS